MGEAIDQTSKQIDTLTNKVDDVNKDLSKANKELKQIVEKFRKPHRCCLDVFLVLILIGLIVGIVHYAKQ
jgi:t-SNARE complex subunit (syntaxin)